MEHSFDTEIHCSQSHHTLGLRPVSAALCPALLEKDSEGQVSLLRHQLQNYHRRAIAQPGAQLHYSSVASGSILITRCQYREYLFYCIPISHKSQGSTPSVKVTAFAQGHDLLRHTLDLLGLGLSSADLLMLEKISHLISI